MRWNKKDIEQYALAKEYVDTILLPLMPFSVSNDAESPKISHQYEILSLFANEIERELAGRVMLLPSYLYLNAANKEDEVNRINDWVTDVQKQPFSNVFFITFDLNWKKHEQVLNGNLIWLPGMQSVDINAKESQSIVNDQVAQISELIRSYW